MTENGSGESWAGGGEFRGGRRDNGLWTRGVMKQGGKADEKMARVVAVVPQYLPHSFQPGRQLHAAGDRQGAVGG